MNAPMTSTFLPALWIATALASPLSAQAPEVTTALPRFVEWSVSGPGARTGHAMAFDPNSGGVVLFGGHDASGTWLADTWLWNGASWWRLNPKVSPPAGHGHRLYFDAAAKKLHLFGGTYASGSNQDWFFDGVNWSSASYRTSRTSNSNVISWRGKIAYRASGNILHLDHVPETGSPAMAHPALAEYRGELFSLKGKHLYRWRASTGPRDPGAWIRGPQFSSTVDANDLTLLFTDRARDRLVVFDPENPLIAEWDGVKFREWDRRIRLGLSPRLPLQGGAAMVYDEIRNQVVIFGGVHKDGRAIDHIFRYAFEAGFSVYGKGCTGTRGVPRLATRSGETPRVRQFFSVDVTNLPAGTVPVTLMVGMSNSAWGSAKLPFDLSVLGMNGCALHVAYEHEFVIWKAGWIDRATWSMLLPELPGFTFYLQALVPDPKANAFGMTVSNGAEVSLGW
jgi:hypothetical protein